MLRAPEQCCRPPCRQSEALAGRGCSGRRAYAQLAKRLGTHCSLAALCEPTIHNDCGDATHVVLLRFRLSSPVAAHVENLHVAALARHASHEPNGLLAARTAGRKDLNRSLGHVLPPLVPKSISGA